MYIIPSPVSVNLIPSPQLIPLNGFCGSCTDKLATALASGQTGGCTGKYHHH